MKNVDLKNPELNEILNQQSIRNCKITRDRMSGKGKEATVS